MVPSCSEGNFSSVNLWLLLFDGNIWCLCLLFQNLEQWNPLEKDEVKKENGEKNYREQEDNGHKRKSALRDDQFRRGRKDAECMACIKIFNIYLLQAFRFVLLSLHWSISPKPFYRFFLYLLTKYTMMNKLNIMMTFGVILQKIDLLGKAN